jgi:methyl-accepting chemotaxis protein
MGIFSIIRKSSIIISVILVSIVILATLFFFIPKITEENTIEAAKRNAEHMVTQMKLNRAYYVDAVVGDVKKFAPNIKFHHSHDGVDGKLPLPTTTIHDLSKIYSENTGLKFQLYSDFPFKNREDRVLTKHQKEALKFSKENEDGIHVQRDKVDGKEVLRVAVTDFMTSQACVSCHNSHPDRTWEEGKWKVGDKRGVVEVIMPLDEELAANNQMKKYILGFISLMLFLLVVYYSFIAIKREKELLDKNNALDSQVQANLEKEKMTLEQDKILISEAQRVMQKIKDGDYSNVIQNSTSNQSLNNFKNDVNDMIVNTKNNLELINQRLKEYTNYNYKNRVDISNIKDGTTFSDTVADINLLREAIVDMLSDNKSNGLTLDMKSKELLQNVDLLNNNSNTSAHVLANTVESLDEITSNIKTNNTNVIQMSDYAKQLSSSAIKGRQLANDTTTSMDDINNEVSSINEAITVIDQIAFQTNILSLNAAVEAATAGEAGKGFAVVAGEVRNLANRSAEAAKEIKVLVEHAIEKTNGGKNISDNMIKGYETLDKNISSTLELISGVQTASNSQLQIINKINSDMSELENRTKENVDITNNTNQVAIQTDEMANLIVAEVNKKEFEGKDNIKPKVLEH